MENKEAGLMARKFLIVACLFLPLFFSGCKSEKKVVEETPPMSDQTIEKFTITETEEGKLKMVLEAESAVINENTKMAFLRLPRVKFYHEGQYSSTLITESADINLETYDIAGHGKCTVDTAGNEHLQTTDLKYDAAKKIVYSNNDVTLTRDGDTVYGKGFEADTKLDKVIIKKQKIIINKAR